MFRASQVNPTSVWISLAKILWRELLSLLHDLSILERSNTILELSSCCMPAISSVWMESSRWHQQPLEWATYANLLAPQVNVRGRMALILLVAVIWAFSW